MRALITSPPMLKEAKGLGAPPPPPLEEERGGSGTLCPPPPSTLALFTFSLPLPVKTWEGMDAMPSLDTSNEAERRPPPHHTPAELKAIPALNAGERREWGVATIPVAVTPFRGPTQWHMIKCPRARPRGTAPAAGKSPLVEGGKGEVKGRECAKEGGFKVRTSALKAV